MLHIGLKPNEYMYSLNVIHRLKESFGPPDRYLCVNVEKVNLKYGQFVCSSNCVDYLKSKIDYVDNSLGVDKILLDNDEYGHRP